MSINIAIPWELVVDAAVPIISVVCVLISYWLGNRNSRKVHIRDIALRKSEAYMDAMISSYDDAVNSCSKIVMLANDLKGLCNPCAQWHDESACGMRRWELYQETVRFNQNRRRYPLTSDKEMVGLLDDFFQAVCKFSSNLDRGDYSQLDSNALKMGSLLNRVQECASSGLDAFFSDVRDKAVDTGIVDKDGSEGKSRIFDRRCSEK